MFKSLTTRPFWVNLLTAIVLALLILFLFLKMLGCLTKHGDYLKVPAVVGMNTNEAVKLLERQGFEVYIQDSIFTDTAKRGIVLKQLPDPNATVKVNRTVFITVNRFTPPLIEMPKLEGQSLSFALKMLERNHLKLGDTTFKPYFMLGSVMEQHFNGMRIAEKTKIPWGSTIDLVIASGLEKKEMAVPSMINMTYCEAKAYLEENGISQGALIAVGPISDTCSAYIVKQNPERFDADNMMLYIQSGQLMDLWISQAMKEPEDSIPGKKNDKPSNKKDKNP